jgi:predicted RNase H-like HicB family nuclease
MKASRLRGKNMLAYPVDIEEDGKWLLVTCPDIPPMVTQGDGIDDALEMAKDALITCLDFYYERREPIPPPSPAKPEQQVVTLPTDVELTVIRWNEELARQGLAINPIEEGFLALAYPADVTEAEDGKCTATFPDFPEITAQASDLSEIYDNAFDVLNETVAAALDADLPVPMPSTPATPMDRVALSLELTRRLLDRDRQQPQKKGIGGAKRCQSCD